MVRGWVTAAVSALIIGTLGFMVLIIGLAYPARPLFAWAARWWARAILWVAGLELQISGRERIQGRIPRLLIGNHQSGLDIPILLAACRGNVRFMAKDSLFRIPILGWILSRYEFAPIDRTHARRAAASLDRMLERLRRNPISFAVFPEGTRSRDGRLLPFRRGTMKIAARTGLPVVPFTIDGSINVHHRDQYVIRPGAVRLTFHPEIPANDVANAKPDELCHRLVSIIGGALSGADGPPVPRIASVAIERP
jgi:1-acyl-sn-glycerol-3-phosphate acyltransferase